MSLKDSISLTKNNIMISEKITVPKRNKINSNYSSEQPENNELTESLENMDA
jgi:hypothetical protein